MSTVPRALHKPLLLLCLLEITAEGGLTEEIMPVTGELAFRFASYWSVVVHRRPNLSCSPFWDIRNGLILHWLSIKPRLLAKPPVILCPIILLTSAKRSRCPICCKAKAGEIMQESKNGSREAAKKC